MILSTILDRKFKLKIGRKLARSSEGSECSFRSRVISAVLYSDGKVPEERKRFTIVVMGFISTGKRDFKGEVRIS